MVATEKTVRHLLHILDSEAVQPKQWNPVTAVKASDSWNKAIRFLLDQCTPAMTEIESRLSGDGFHIHFFKEISEKKIRNLFSSLCSTAY